MRNLLRLQHQFQQFLLRGDEHFKDNIISTEQVSAEQRLSIYSNAYHSRLIEALESNYPMLALHFGKENFVSLASDYINQFPSQYRSIRFFGDQLSQFLMDHPLAHDFPYLPEFAAFEWLQTLVFDAANGIPLAMDDITQISPELWENMRFGAHPSLQRINLFWNIVPIWESHSQNKKPPLALQDKKSVPWLLWRKDLLNHFSSLTDDEAWAIDAVLKQQTFGEICVGLCQWFDEQEVGIRAASLLKGWIQSKILVEVIY